MRMQAAVNPGTATTVPLLGGDAGTEQTIAAIRELVDQSLNDPRVRQTAGRIVHGVRPYDELAEVRAIYAWVQRHIRFTKDPVGKETLANAHWILSHGFGDCDEINAILFPALLGAVGYRTRLVTIASNPTAPQSFSHIYAEVWVRGRWIPMDAARPGTRFGSAPPRYFRKRIWSLSNTQFEDVSGLSGYHTMGQIDWGKIIPQVSAGVTSAITAARQPSLPIYQQQLPQQPLFASSVLPGIGISTNTLLLGAALVVGAYLLAQRKKRR